MQPKALARREESRALPEPLKQVARVIKNPRATTQPSLDDELVVCEPAKPWQANQPTPAQKKIEDRHHGR